MDINNISLITFDKDNQNHLSFYKMLRDDITIRNRFQGLLPALLKQSNEMFEKGFLVAYNDELVGYIDVSNYCEAEEAVYLRGAIEKNQRGKGYGKAMLTYVSDLIFKTYPFVRRIKLKIDLDNDASLFTAGASHYKWIEKDYFSLENPYLTQQENIKK